MPIWASILIAFITCILGAYVGACAASHAILKRLDDASTFLMENHATFKDADINIKLGLFMAELYSAMRDPQNWDS